uniref:Ribosomal RNA-processing protein 42 n=1 Tax=Arcella intermedia TaxID=1963864 RepID=A0A6B2LD68_9EUKA
MVMDSTDILVGIKAELGEPNEETPEEGKVIASVDCCPSASPEFEGKGGAQINVELATVMQRMLQGAAVDLRRLCLLPGQQCWVLYIDAMVLDSGGNLFDALSIAIRAALANTTLPTITVSKGDNQEEFELELDPDRTISLPIDNVPICVTLSKVGKHFVVDSTLEEELCTSCRLTFAVNQKGHLFTIQKGFGTISPVALPQLISTAQNVSSLVIQEMDKLLQAEAQGKKQKIGFLL